MSKSIDNLAASRARRWGRLGRMHCSLAEDPTSNGKRIPASAGESPSVTNRREGTDISPMCPRCCYLSRTNPPPSQSHPESYSSPEFQLGRYSLCSVNREIQREVSGSRCADASSPTTGEGTRVNCPSSPAASTTSGSGATAAVGAASCSPPDSLSTKIMGAFCGNSPENQARGGYSSAAAQSESEAIAVFTDRDLGASCLHSRKVQSSLGFVDDYSESSPRGEGLCPLLVGDKRTRDRRAYRKNKDEDPQKDFLRAMEERLLMSNGFGLKSIRRRLQQMDEMLQKEVSSLS